MVILRMIEIMDDDEFCECPCMEMDRGAEVTFGGLEMVLRVKDWKGAEKLSRDVCSLTSLWTVCISMWEEFRECPCNDTDKGAEVTFGGLRIISRVTVEELIECSIGDTFRGTGDMKVVRMKPELSWE